MTKCALVIALLMAVIPTSAGVAHADVHDPPLASLHAYGGHWRGPWPDTLGGPCGSQPRDTQYAAGGVTVQGIPVGLLYLCGYPGYRWAWYSPAPYAYPDFWITVCVEWQYNEAPGGGDLACKETYTNGAVATNVVRSPAVATVSYLGFGRARVPGSGYA
jgi:hypothetical protein